MGKFIVFEGLDGVGKTTQISLLRDYLESRGEKVFMTAEPTAAPTGKLLREVLGGRVSLSPWGTASLFLTDRINHCSGENGITEHLKKGETVITDRYYFSTFAYQGIDIDLDYVTQMHYRCPEIEHPDLVIFMTMTPEKCIKRITLGRNAEDIEIFENTESLKKISARFDTVFEVLGDRENVVRIDADGTVEEVAGRIRQAVDNV